MKSFKPLRVTALALFGLLVLAALAVAADLHRERNYDRYTGKPVRWVIASWPKAPDEFRLPDPTYVLSE